MRHRDAVMRAIRAFFYAEDFIEVETPIRVASPCMELNIEVEPSGSGFLRTSPELFHKRLLARGATRIFEMGKCFRQGELGRLHHPEYTMLEWYRAESDYDVVLEDTRRLLQALRPCATEDFAFLNRWQVLEVEEAFLSFAGWNPVEQFDEDRFDVDLVEKVEPGIGRLGGAVVLKNYPAEVAALARTKADDPRKAERWELYLDGIEVANAYSELVDPVEQRARFEACAALRRARGNPIYPLDEAFLNELGRMPPSGGIALGVDRLVMLLGGFSSLDEVLLFRDHPPLN
jgi:elongation factor P--(R)-beta-lysine ligase